MTHPTIISISLRLPSKACHPNARPHYMAKADAKKADRKLACYLALEVMGGKTFGWKKATAHAYFTLKREQDHDNLAAWLKSYWDGLTDAGLLADDRGLTHLPITVIKGKVPGVVLVLAGGGE